MGIQDTQTKYLSEEGGGILVPLLLRFENIEQEFKEQFGVQLPHKNKAGRHRKWEYYYDQELKDIIANKYKDDFRNFNYAIT